MTSPYYFNGILFRMRHLYFHEKNPRFTFICLRNYFWDQKTKVKTKQKWMKNCFCRHLEKDMNTHQVQYHQIQYNHHLKKKVGMYLIISEKKADSYVFFSENIVFSFNFFVMHTLFTQPFVSHLSSIFLVILSVVFSAHEILHSCSIYPGFFWHSPCRAHSAQLGL